MKRQRLKPKIRKHSIVQTALRLAVKHGYTNITRRQIAQTSGVSEAAVSYYFGTMAQLRRDILRHAIQQEVLHIIAQALVNNDPYIARVPTSLLSKAAYSLTQAK